MKGNNMIKKLYDKEREYERKIFGEYHNNPSLSFPSFILFIEEYVRKAKEAYAGKWEKELPPWLENCTEHENCGSAPVKAYEEIIKVLALAGAALETYSIIDPDKWREDSESDISKWKN